MKQTTKIQYLVRYLEPSGKWGKSNCYSHRSIWFKSLSEAIIFIKKHQSNFQKFGNHPIHYHEFEANLIRYDYVPQDKLWHRHNFIYQYSFKNDEWSIDVSGMRPMQEHIKVDEDKLFARWAA